jgi:putative ABC transport system permease protein
MRPPRIAERIIAAVSGPSPWTETTLGDLSEEHAARSTRRGSMPADVWYWLQTISIVGGVVARGLSRAWRAVVVSLKTGDSPMRTLIAEFRFALRTLRRQPLVAAAVITTIALGLGANAAAFSMLNALVFQPFSFPNLDRLAIIAEYSPQAPFSNPRASPANFLDWQRQADRFDHMAAFAWSDVNMTGGQEAERVHGFQVSGSFFEMIGTQPAMGRLIAPEDDVLGSHRVMVLSDALWKRSFGARADVVGLPVRVDGEPYTVVGVAPAGFEFPLGSEYWRPLAMNAATAALRNQRYIAVMGLLKPGSTMDDAQAQMSVIGARLRQQHPVDNRDFSPRVQTLTLGMIDPGLPAILSMIQLGALVVLLIGGANIVNLLLARGADRQREIALRLAIGGSRLRIIRQLITESLVLGAVAVPIALALAHLALQAVKGTLPARVLKFVPGWENLGVDLPLVGVALLGALVTALLLGLFPAMQTSRPDLTSALREGGRNLTGGRSRQRLRRFVVIAELALALPLLVAAGLAASGGYQFSEGPQGYEPAGVMTMQTRLPDSYATPQARRQFADRLIDEAARLPGVTSAATINAAPTSDSDTSRAIEIDGRPIANPSDRPVLMFRVVSARYFDVMSIPILRGRAFSAEDGPDGQPVALVSQSMAARYWPNQDPIGRRVRTFDNPESPWMTVVGITGDVIDDWFNRRNAPAVYVSASQRPTYSVTLVARTTGDPTQLGPGMRAALRTIDPNQPPILLTSMSQALHDRTSGIRTIGVMMAALGGLALVLATIGLYSLLAYDVIQRRQEIGVRMALGATRGDVVRFTIGHVGRLAGIGLGVGFGLAILAGRAVESALFGVVSLGAPLLVGITLTLCATALLAGVVPARQASRVDPATSLQAQ